MNARMAKSILCSLCLHLALSLLIGKTVTFRYGAAQGTNAAHPTLAVHLVTKDRNTQQVIAIESGRPSHARTRPKRAEKKPADMVSTTFTPPQAAGMAAPAALSTYISAGLLTRLPAPITDINLNVAEITEAGFEGKIDLTLLIDTDGTVADVIAATTAEYSSSFLENVAARFKQARFFPGEVDGKAVNAQLRISVVSERTAANGEHR